MKRRSAFYNLILAVCCFLIVFSFSSCSTSHGSADRGKKSSYSKVRSHQPSWNSSTSPKTRYNLKQKKNKKNSKKRDKGRTAKTKSRTYSIFN